MPSEDRLPLLYRSRFVAVAAVMKDVVIFAAAVNAVLFFTAAVGKVDDWRGWTDLTKRLAPVRPIQAVLRLVVPGCEVATAAVLVVDVRVGMLTAAALYVSLALVPLIRYRALAGQPCACFGAIHSSQIDWRLISRNALCAVASASLAATAPSSVGRALPVLALCTGALALLALALCLRIHAEAAAFASNFGTALLARRKDSG